LARGMLKFLVVKQFKIQSFSTGALSPPWGPRNGSPGPTSRGLYWITLPLYWTPQNKARCFYWWAEGYKCWESLEGSQKPWKIENHWFKYCWSV